MSIRRLVRLQFFVFPRYIAVALNLPKDLKNRGLKNLLSNGNFSRICNSVEIGVSWNSMGGVAVPWLPAQVFDMSDDPQNQVLELQKENAKLSRQLSRLQATIERNNAAAASAASITAMQAAEKRKQEHYMRSMLENSPDAILLLDSDAVLFIAHKKHWKLPKSTISPTLTGNTTARFLSCSPSQIGSKTWNIKSMSPFWTVLTWQWMPCSTFAGSNCGIIE